MFPFFSEDDTDSEDEHMGYSKVNLPHKIIHESKPMVPKKDEETIITKPIPLINVSTYNENNFNNNKIT